MIAKIVSAINIQPDDLIIEIGPGLGALTEPILELVKFLHAIELDRNLAAELGDRLAADRCKIHQCDALAFDYKALTDSAHNLRIIGNLPYNISTPLIFHLLGQQTCIKDMHFMLQKEVVERMVAGPGSRSYGRLGIMLQIYCQCEKLFNVGSASFNPRPKVDSAVVRLIPHPHPQADDETLHMLDPLLKQVFSRRRKTIRNCLRGLLDEADIDDCKVDPGKRPEQLDIHQFIMLAQRLVEIEASKALL